MALNYWKIGGKATNFNPLPSTYSYGSSLNSMNLPSILNNPYCNAVLSFWAYSPSSGIVHLNSTNVGKDFPLSPTRQFYSFVLNSSLPFNHIDLYDKNANGDIVIDSISLVQAPLAKKTINGIDGFLSGKWGYGGASTAPATLNIVDDTTAILVSTDTSWKNAYIIIPTIPNTTYTFLGNFSSDSTSSVALRIDGVTTATSSGGGPLIYNGVIGMGFSPITFTTPNSTYGNFTMIYFQTHSIESLTMTKPMLVRGSFIPPYEPKHGDNMVMPVPTKNLVPFKSYSGTFNTTLISGQQGASILIENLPVKPNTTYTIYMDYTSSYQSFTLITQQRTTSATNHNALYTDIISNNVGTQYASSGNSITFTTKSNEYFVSITTGNSGAGTYPSIISYDNIQLEQSSTPTGFTPYTVTSNKQPSKISGTPITAEYTSNFVGKIYGSTVENPNIFYANANCTSLYTPTQMNWETPQAYYPMISTLDGTSVSFSSNKISGNQSEMMFKFNIIEILERNYGASIWQGNTNLANKISIAKNVISKLTLNWYGFGTSPTGNKATIGMWDGVGGWVVGGSNTTGTVSPINLVYTTSSQFSRIDSNGMMYWLAYANASDGTTVSTIYSDYVEIVVDISIPTSVNKISQDGISFNGTTDYVKLNSVSRYPIGDFTIETEFMLNDATKTSTSLIGNDSFALRYDGASTNSLNLVKYAVIDQRVHYVLNSNVRYKLKAVVHSTYTEYFINDVSVGTFSNSSAMNVASYGSLPITVGSDNRVSGGAMNYTNGVIYSMHMYDSTGDIVNFDFTNPTIASTTVLTSGNINLIPSFDDLGWYFHSSFTPLGLDYATQNAVSAWSDSYYFINVLPNTNYLALTGNPNPNMRLYIKSPDGLTSLGASTSSPLTFNSGSYSQIKVILTNPVTGNLVYMKPQLYQLTGQEGTINGIPKQSSKQSKRILYAKR